MRRSPIQTLAHVSEFHPTPEFFSTGLPSRGEGSVRIEMAGFGIRLVGLAPGEASRLTARYGAFAKRIDPRPGDAVVRVVEARVPHFLIAGARMGEGPEIYRMEQRWIGSRLLAYSYEFAGWFDFPGLEGELALTEGCGEGLDRAIENFLRAVTAHRALDRGDFLLHGAGVVRGGRAHVFFGPSGAGKTTVTLLSGGSPILSDDLVLIRRGVSGCEACSVPFRGLYREPPETDLSFPLAGLYRLIQCPADSLEKLAPAKAVMDLVASLPFVVEGGERSSRALEVIAEAVRDVPVFRLRFRKSPEFWDLLLAEREGR